MARTVTGAQATVLGSANYWVEARVWVTDIDGNWRNLSHPADLSPPNFEVDPGNNWLEFATITEAEEQRVATATVTLRRDETGGVSLAPLIETSSANVDSGASYGALIDPGRNVRIEVATTAFGTTAVEADFQILFEGEIDIVDAASESMFFECRGKGAELEDRWVEDVTKYGTEAGREIELVIQDVLTAWTSGVTLYSANGTGGTPFNAGDSPGFFVTEYEQQQMSVMDAIEQLAGLIGYSIRYRWHNNTSDFQLVLEEPERTSPSVDWTLGASDYFDVNTVRVDRTNVRNAITVRYWDENQVENTSTAASSGSIGRYGRRPMEITEGGDSPINTSSEGSALAIAALADLEEPDLDQEVSTQTHWAIQLNDYITWTANSVHYTSNQSLSVTQVRHELGRNTHRTYVRVRGKPSGAYRDWTTRLKPEPLEIVLNSWEWVPENRSRLGAPTFNIAWSWPPETQVLNLHLKPLKGVRSVGITVASSTGDVGTDVVDMTTAGVGGGDFFHKYAAGFTSAEEFGFLFGPTAYPEPRNFTMTAYPYSSTGGSTGGGAFGDPIVVDLGYFLQKGWGTTWETWDGVMKTAARTKLRPFFDVGTGAGTSSSLGLPTNQDFGVAAIYDAGIIAAATWTPDYANGPAQYAFFQADCEIQLPDTIDTGTAETFHLYLDTNGYSISFADTGYSFPNGSALAVNLTHWNGIINHQGVLSGTLLPNMLLGGVNITF